MPPTVCSELCVGVKLQPPVWGYCRQHGGGVVAGPTGFRGDLGNLALPVPAFPTPPRHSSAKSGWEAGGGVAPPGRLYPCPVGACVGVNLGFLINLKGGQERIPSAGSLPRMIQWLGLGQARSPTLVSHVRAGAHGLGPSPTAFPQAENCTGSKFKI